MRKLFMHNKVEADAFGDPHLELPNWVTGRRGRRPLQEKTARRRSFLSLCAHSSLTRVRTPASPYRSVSSSMDSLSPSSLSFVAVIGSSQSIPV